ncbi:hypothetical protein N2152v2_002903 [Parachlorella kessleri]
MYFAERLGSEVLWQLFGSDTHPIVMRQVLRYLAAQSEAGVVQLDSTRLSQLVRCPAAWQESGALVAMLHTVREQQLALTSDDVYSALLVWRSHPESLELAKLLLSMGPPLARSQASKLAWKAAKADKSALLELLVAAGARIDEYLVAAGSWALGEGDLRALHMLEASLAAGYRPSVYRDTTLPQHWVHMDLFDPLKHRRSDFPRNGGSRWLWVALEGWSPATHHQHPTRMKGVFQAFLLAAAQGRMQHGGQEAGIDSNAKRPCLAAAQSSITHGSCPADASLLAKLPMELLLHVLQLAAHPLSAWLAVKTES